MSIIAITGSGSGIGAATAARLQERGHRVLGIDIRDADIIADLSQPREPKVTKFRNIGSQPYDGLVTPNGRHYIAGMVTGVREHLRHL